MNLQYLRQKLGHARFSDSTKQWDTEQQREFWNDWNSVHLQAETLGEEALRRARKVLELVQGLSLPAQPRILEVGCANGWFSEWLLKVGNVYGIDLSDVSIEEAKRRLPRAQFLADDVLSVNLLERYFDLVVSLETISHVADQPRFVKVIAETLRPGGYLLVATQNGPIYSRKSNIAPPAEGQLRHWLARKELVSLLKPYFRCLKVLTIEPAGDLGFMRIVDSPKLNSAFERVLSKETIKSIKERLGFGQTLIVVAEKK